MTQVQVMARPMVRLMAELLLDVTVFEDYRDGHAGARSIMQRVLTGEIVASVASLTVFDLWRGSGFDRRAEIGYSGMLSFLEEAQLSINAAKTAGVWLASIPGPERESLARSALIAAVASERAEHICTRNPVLFSRFYSRLVDY